MQDKLTFLEITPTRLAGLGVGAMTRVKLTRAALDRGNELAARLKPLMAEQTDLHVEGENLAGSIRCEIMYSKVAARTAALRNQIADLRSLVHETTSLEDTP